MAFGWSSLALGLIAVKPLVLAHIAWLRSVAAKHTVSGGDLQLGIGGIP